MAEVINLRLARKARQRAEAADQAAQNRAKFGQSKAARAHDRAEAERASRAHDSHRREDS